MDVWLPQEHLQYQYTLGPRDVSLRMTVSLPIVCPVKSCWRGLPMDVEKERRGK